MLNKVVVLNLALLITHQVDAAYWHEWEMFSIPGGIQFFNIFNLVLFVLLGACFVAVVERRASGFLGSIVIATTSALVLPIHAGFALAGFTQFHLPVSIVVIMATFVASVVQVLITLNQRSEFGDV